MLCVYFEIPYERQLMRIAATEVQNVLNSITDMAESNGAVSFKMPCASVYQFSMDSAAPVFSTNLFLRFLVETLRTYKERILTYHVIIDCCEEGALEDSIADCFTAYQSQLIPGRGFFASAQAEQLLHAYIHFEYSADYNLYYCADFLIPKAAASRILETTYTLYIPETVSWLHALYHFMLLHPLDEEVLTENLSAEERQQYESGRYAIYYFRKNRFRSGYPAYFIDAFLWYVRLYFRAFARLHSGNKITVVYSQNNKEAAVRILEVIPFAVVKLREKHSVSLKNLSADFIQLAYLIICAAWFIFEDEVPAFFALLHKSSRFIESLYEWLYAADIIEEKNDIYAVNPGAAKAIADILGSKKTESQHFITAFLWEKYKQGVLAPDENLKKIFDMLHFKPEDSFLLHYFFYTYADAEIPALTISPYKENSFFYALENYQRALKIAAQKNTSEAVHAVKNAVSAVQNLRFPAGEYRALTCVALFYLSQNKTEDAVTYFDYALDSAELLKDGGFICEALMHLSISSFIQNNLAAASNYLERLAQAAAEYFEYDRKVPCLFMQGRVALQLGDYTKAEQLFQMAEAAAIYFPQWKPLCQIWYARTFALRGQTLKAQQMLTGHLSDSPDALIFLVESYLLAPILHDDLLTLLPETFTSASEPYKSGFVMAEELVWGHSYNKPVQAVCYAALSSYYRLKTALRFGNAAVEQYLAVLEEIARDALRCRDMDAPIYGYVCYDAFLLCAGVYSDAANGYLSRAFRALQNCMENMTENSIRDKFIFRNVWNAKLYAAAQKNKLI